MKTTSRRTFSRIVGLTVGVLLLTAVPASAAAPALIPIQGSVADSRDRPLTGQHEIIYSLWTAATEGDQLWSDTRTVTFDQGVFSEYLGGDANPIDLSWFADHGTVYVHMAVDGDNDLARVQIATSPYAAFAQYCGDASTLMGVAPSDLAYTAGDGLTLSGRQFSASQSSVETWARAVCYDSAAELRQDLDGVYKLASYAPAWGDISGIPADLLDGDDGTAYSAGDGLTLTAGAFAINASGCAAGYTLVRDNTNASWTCAELDYTQIANTPNLSVFALDADLATVATSGAYTDLSGRPDLSGYALTSSLATVATSGAYADLTGRPTLATVATSGAYADLSGRPDLSGYALTSSLATVATSGAYADLSGRPTLATVATSGAYTDLSGRPDLSGYALTSSLATVATSGAYADLTGRPTLATVATTGAYADLSGRPDLSGYALTSSLATVATSGAYADLTGRPTLATVATSGAYADLTGRPTLATVATSGSYNDLLDKPSTTGGGVSAFGDGSAGSLTISSNTNWNTTPPTNNNFQFTDLTINTGITLTVPSGTIIRCSGTLTNNGTITVLAGIDVSSGHEGGRGLSKKAPYGVFFDEGTGQVVGRALSSGEALTILRPPRETGGSGGWGWNASSGAGDGGGSMVVRASTAVTNAGTIRANGGAGAAVSGATGNGGGAGGFVIIVSKGNITNSGTIQANGGAGANAVSVTDGGAGGGGGGGIVHLMGPNASTVAGTVQASGGSPGTNSGNGTGTWGGPGGALGGNGGNAGDGSGNPATAGATGLVLRSQVTDPSALFF